MACFCYCVELGGKITHDIEDTRSYAITMFEVLKPDEVVENKLQGSSSSRAISLTNRHTSTSRHPPNSYSLSSHSSKGRKRYFSPMRHRCDHFAFPPPPPVDRRRTGPRRKFFFLT